MNTLRKWLLCLWLAPLPLLAATNDSTNQAGLSQTDYLQARETMRTQCIRGRRIICGRILKVLPGGLIIDSGYTNLMRRPLDRFWLIPSTVETERDPSLVENNEADCPCVGLVYVTDPPKTRRRAKPKPLDYVVLQGFPAGQFTYTSAGTVQRTVRHFSGTLAVAVQLNLEARPSPTTDPARH